MEQWNELWGFFFDSPFFGFTRIDLWWWIFCFQVMPNGNLILPPFRAEDYSQEVHAQTYRCLAQNNFGKIQSREVHVRAGKTSFATPPLDNLDLGMMCTVFKKRLIINFILSTFNFQKLKYWRCSENAKRDFFMFLKVDIKFSLSNQQLKSLLHRGNLLAVQAKMLINLAVEYFSRNRN